ncbi:DgyrCDS8702 [Dimorphilus gyrociliatus]|uniref:DgyrCDS8702 n=1 Tax=Dimorphilus gyrociliatus TaxID=2664684 RepID=A0A7I8W030_9ANNE|nr:DgyrCDS8702 [Dimorphilus gyrociliatus]
METEPAGVQLLRDACKKRGVNGIRSLSRTFRIYDDDGSKYLSREEFGKGIHDYGVNISEGDITEMFSYFDKDKSGHISVNEFIEKIRPNMSDGRIKLIEKAFQKLDVTGDGVITIEDLKRQYEYKKHPKYISGEWSANRVYKEFLNNFQQGGVLDETVTWKEFLDYYRGISSNFDKDIQFDLMMRNCWKL